MLKEIKILDCKYDNRASFGGKAKIVDNGEFLVLLSYDVPVLKMSKANRAVFVIGSRFINRSNTTKRHVREFYKQMVDSSADNSKINKILSEIEPISE